MNPPAVARESDLGHKLDAWRAGAALLVVLEHARSLFVGDFAQVAQPDLATKAFYFVTGLGHAAVIVFFVLSGFFVGGSVRRSFAGKRWSWRGYAAARLSRLWTVLIPALLLGYAWDLAGLRFFPDSPVYSGDQDFRFLLPPNLGAHLSPSILLGNAAFLAEAIPFGASKPLVPALGSNGPLWSLTYEFGYYLLFPIALLIFRRRWIWLPIGLAVAFLLGPAVLALFPIWLMGAWLAGWKPPKWVGGFAARAGSWMLLVAIVAGHRLKYAWHPVPWDLALGVAFSIYLATLLASPSGGFPSGLRAPTTFLANMSYTLYLVHLPLMVWIAAYVGPTHYSSTWERMASTALAVSISLLYAAGVWWFTERRTDTVRAWMARRLGVA